ncbi:MAG: dTDP-4-dehydrorhamnose reductase [Porticoccaceae bacterium]
MTILLLGKNGQLGWELQRALAPLGNLVALDRHGGDGLGGDLADVDGLRHSIERLRPAIIVNAAAYTAVDKAEDERDLAALINTAAPAVLGDAAKRLGAWLVHYSTDYVFDGSGTTPWRENDRVAPLNHYGRTKLEGEQAIAASGCRHLIFRTSWVYGAHGNNFAKTMLRLARERQTLSVVCDQIGAPTGAELLADATVHALQQARSQPEKGGLYHLAPAGETSWHEYAGFVIDRARAGGETLAVEAIEPIASTAYPTPARRPANSRLDTSAFRAAFALHLPPWQQGVARMVSECLA